MGSFSYLSNFHIATTGQKVYELAEHIHFVFSCCFMEAVIDRHEGTTSIQLVTETIPACPEYLSTVVSRRYCVRYFGVGKTILRIRNTIYICLRGVVHIYTYGSRNVLKNHIDMSKIIHQNYYIHIDYTHLHSTISASAALSVCRNFRWKSTMAAAFKGIVPSSQVKKINTRILLRHPWNGYHLSEKIFFSIMWWILMHY